jgi:copper oxidase (laccase) domain-containing protein
MPGDVDAPVAPLEFFPALERVRLVRHAFIRRVPGIDVTADREEALARLERSHRAARDKLGLTTKGFVTAQQVHGNHIALVDQPLPDDTCFGAADGLITNRSDISLGIYVADCCAVYIVDPVKHAIGLVHSGKKGTALGIAAKAIAQMRQRFGSRTEDLIVQLSPCIRPPHYEIDFAAEIVRQLHDAGVRQVYDCGVCTACDLSRYYSYRAEKARTGRMLALLALNY